MTPLWENALRYLGCRTPQQEQQAVPLLQRAFGELERIAQPRAAWTILPCRAEKEAVWLEALHIPSRALAGVLAGCEEVVLLAATLGVQVDTAIARASVMEVSYALALQACAAARIEMEAGEWMQKAGRAASGRYLTPTCAPGWEDFPLESQAALLERVNAAHRTGITCLESGMLVPTKSVLQVAGLSPRPCASQENKCARCAKRDCAFRKERT